MSKDLPIAPEAIGNYVTYKKIGNYVYTSGHVPITELKKFIGSLIKSSYLIKILGTDLKAFHDL